jgi:hypothetical protein
MSVCQNLIARHLIVLHVKEPSMYADSAVRRVRSFRRLIAVAIGYVMTKTNTCSFPMPVTVAHEITGVLRYVDITHVKNTKETGRPARNAFQTSSMKWKCMPGTAPTNITSPHSTILHRSNPPIAGNAEGTLPYPKEATLSSVVNIVARIAPSVMKIGKASSDRSKAANHNSRFCLHCSRNFHIKQIIYLALE